MQVKLSSVSMRVKRLPATHGLRRLTLEKRHYAAAQQQTRDSNQQRVAQLQSQLQELQGPTSSYQQQQQCDPVAAAQAALRPCRVAAVSSTTSGSMGSQCEQPGTPDLTDISSSQSSNLSSSQGSTKGGVFVGNLAADVTERMLLELFSICGRAEKLWVARNATSKASLGYGFVVFDTNSGPKAAQLAAQQLDGTTVHQKRITVKVSDRDFSQVSKKLLPVRVARLP